MSVDGLDVTVNVPDGADLVMRAERLAAAVRHTLTAEGVSTAEVSLTLLGDAEIRSLNLEYLDRDRPTDVIAFALHEAGEPPLGDVYVGVEQAARQAEEWGATVEEELLRLAVHGTLHVLGYDHPEGEDRTESPMFERQESLVRELLSGGQP